MSIYYLSGMLAIMMLAAAFTQAEEITYTEDWKSLDARPMPKWFDDAKFGIFIHWGVYSVPAWGAKGTYSEWYWHALRSNSHDGATRKFHERVYGRRFDYMDFAPMFTCELFDANEWAALFKRSGAKYVVPTSKHHDGYCIWPSKEASASWERPWNSMEVGPKRDLLGELTKAVRDQDMKSGFYYSLYEWYHPWYKKDFEKYRDEHFIPQFKDVVTRYEPDIIFADGEWDHPSEDWHSPELLAWLFNEAACKDNVVINDRWGKKTRSSHGGYFTTEYGHVGGGKKGLAEGRSWEENRGIGASFGYNRNETIDEYRTTTQLVHLLIDTISRGGNLLLDVGPTADGRIPVIMQDRLIGIGEWLDTNGEAIYGTRKWRVVKEGDSIFYTEKDGIVYAIVTAWPENMLTLQSPEASDTTVQAHLLGYERPLECETTDKGLEIQTPDLTPATLPCDHAWVFKLENVK